MPLPFVRKYDKSRDFTNGLHVCFTTVDKSVDWEPARTVGSYLWYKAYVSVTPDTCFVLDDGNGRAVGYCIGTVDTTKFAKCWREDFTPTIDAKLVPRPGVRSGDPLMEKDEMRGFREAVYNADFSTLQSWPETLETYPAHLHINILPEFQRGGYGKELITTFCDAVKSGGAGGVHLGMAEHNTNARAFYGRIGFQICPQVLDGGASGKTGVNGTTMILVKSL